jgi:hypothetical protein
MSMKRSMLLVFSLLAAACGVELGAGDPLSPEIESVSSPFVSAGNAPTISSRGVNQLEVFISGPGGTFVQSFGANGPVWSGSWAPLPSLPAGFSSEGPAAATSWSSTRTDVFVWAKNNVSESRLYHNWRNAGGWSSTWELIGTGINSPPAVTNWGPNRLDVFALDANKKLKHWFYQTNGWYGPESLYPNVAFFSPPAAVAWAPGRIDIVALGSSLNVNQFYYSDPSGWFGPFNLGGGQINANTVLGISSWGVNRLDVFVVKDHQPKRRSFTGSWEANWTNVLGTLYPDQGGVSAVSWGPNRIDLVTYSSALGTSAIQQAFSTNNPPSFHGWFGLPNP